MNKRRHPDLNSELKEEKRREEERREEDSVASLD